jgi:hypothetical protein
MQNNIKHLGKMGFSSVLAGCKPCWKPKHYPQVTIAIGIIGKQDGQRPAIVLASDSQTTYGAPKSLDAQKIAYVNFKDDQIIVAQAGSSQLGDKVIEGMVKIAKGMSFKNSETGALVAQQALREVRQQLLEAKKDFSYSDMKQICFDNSLELIVAYYFNRKPYMFTLDLERAMFFRVKSPTVAIGIGGDLGKFLLGEYAKVDPSFQYAWPISIDVVEKVIDNINGCGRPTRVSICFPMPQVIADQYIQAGKPFPQSLVTIVSQNEIEMMAEEIRTAEEKKSASHKEHMQKMLQNTWGKTEAFWQKKAHEAGADLN